jgi:hypothetical protein
LYLSFGDSKRTGEFPFYIRKISFSKKYTNPSASSGPTSASGPTASFGPKASVGRHHCRLHPCPMLMLILLWAFLIDCLFL